MNSHFEEFYDLLRIDRKKSSFAGDSTFAVRYEELVKEVEEIRLALEKKDDENLKEELGDVVWDLFCLMIIAEEEYGFAAESIVGDAMAKLKRRKPWLLTDKTVPKEEELRIWNEAKKKEKLEKGNGGHKKTS